MFTNEQKTQFAEQYIRRPTDSMVIVSRIASPDTDPCYCLHLAESLPNDPFVLSEIARIKAIPPDKSTFMLETKGRADKLWDIGAIKEAHAFAKLYAEMAGFILKTPPKEKDDDGKGHVEELAAKIFNSKTA